MNGRPRQLGLTVGIVGSLAALVAALSGCAVVGPRSIAAGRMAYAEAITATSEEQILQAIVRDRYGERLVPLSVSGVTANVRIQSSAGVNLGIGPESAYDGNLVPLSAGVAYEENPIISYAPMDSSTHLQQLLAPIPLDTALLVLRSAPDPKLVSLMMLERMNGLKNPARAAPGDSAEGFLRATDLIGQLYAHDLAELVSLGEQRYGLLLQVGEIKDQDRETDLVELMELLELNELLRELDWTGELPSGRIAGQDSERETPGSDEPVQPEDGDDGPRLAGADAAAVSRSEQEILVISIRFSAVSDASSLALTTRSVYDMFRIAAAAVDVPPEHVESGAASEITHAGLATNLIKIARSRERPESASVASRAHGWWYYIDESDSSSKQYFRMLSMLWAAQLNSASDGANAPLLTVPVGR